jgi:hypothetical protein
MITFSSEYLNQISGEKEKGSINLIAALLNAKNVSYDQKDLEKLRSLHKLRSSKHPIHSGEHEAITVFKSLNIQYPHANWEKAGKICLHHLVMSIEGLTKAMVEHNP